jgi:hypothetical protein
MRFWGDCCGLSRPGVPGGAEGSGEPGSIKGASREPRARAEAPGEEPGYYVGLLTDGEYFPEDELEAEFWGEVSRQGDAQLARGQGAAPPTGDSAASRLTVNEAQQADLAAVNRLLTQLTESHSHACDCERASPAGGPACRIGRNAGPSSA